MESDAEYSESEATTSEGTASDADSEVEIAELMGMPVEASSGKQEYLTRCTELKIVPVAMFIAKLECEHVSLRHHGLGPKGAQAVAAALRTNAKIISLNLSENYFGGAGIHALAEVAASLLPPSTAPFPSPRRRPRE